MLPKKLKDDCIIEALCEVRFRTSEDLPEIVVGRLSDLAPWKTYAKSVMPVSNIPAAMRRNDPDFMYSPYVQLREANGSRLVQIGESVFSYHIVGKYCGWVTFQLELTHAIDAIFDKLDNIVVTRLGFRYLNALTPSRHHVSGTADLNMDIRVAGEQLNATLNLNYEIPADDSHITTTRIASPQYVRGNIPEETSVVVDIDVYTPVGYETQDKNMVHEWVAKAHDIEKAAFFKLLPIELQDKLKEE